MDIEHPDITRAQKTGFPSKRSTVIDHCAYCMTDLRSGEKVIEAKSDTYCSMKCAIEDIARRPEHHGFHETVLED